MEALTKHHEITDFLIDSSDDGFHDVLIASHGVAEERVREVDDLVFAFLQGKIGLEAMPTLLGKAFGKSESDAKKMAADVVGWRILPMKKFVNGVEAMIKSWGGDPAKYPQIVLEKEGIQPDSIARAVLEEKGVTLPDALMKRYEFLAEQFLSGEKDAQWLKEFAARDVNIGGLGISEQAGAALAEALQAQKVEAHEEAGEPMDKQEDAHEDRELDKGLIEELERQMKELEAQLKPARPVKDMLAMPAKKPVVKEEAGLTAQDLAALEQELNAIDLGSTIVGSSVKKASVMPVKSGGDITTPEEQAEVLQHAATGRRPKLELTHEQEAGIDALWTLFKQKRISRMAMQDFAKTYLVGMRSERQIEGLLRDRYRFDEAQVNEIVSTLRKIKVTIEQSQLVPRKDNLPDLGAIQTMEEEVMNKRYAAMTKKANMLGSGAPLDTSAQVSAARSKNEELELQKSKLDPEALKAAVIAAKPVAAKPKLSTPSVPPKDTMRRVTDINYQPQLVGPVEELGTMSVDDFKRLGTNPLEAVNKLQDRIDALVEIAPSKRIEGILAWRRSPVYQVYRSMMQESLTTGASLPEIATNRRNKGEESLTPAEMKALVEVNKNLQF